MSRVKSQRRKIRRPRAKRAKTKKTQKKRTAGMTKPVSDYMKLISDPCGGPLVRAVGPVHQTAVTERLRITNAAFRDGISTSSSKENGYIVWFPSYHGHGSFNAGDAGAARANNMFYFHNAVASATPTNTVAAPAGVALGNVTDGASLTGVFLRDPATLQLATSTPFDRATSLAACLQLDYIGALSSIAGQVCTVSNYSLASFIQNTNAPGAAPSFPSVDNIFSYAAVRSRLHPEGAEVIWRPTDQSSLPRTSADQHAGLGAAGNAPVTDACFWSGSTASSHTTRVVATNPNEVFGICIAWRGVPAGTISLNSVKVAAFELAARNAQIEEVRTGVPVSSPNLSIDAVTNMQDIMHSGWQSSLTRMGAAALGAGMQLAGSFGGGLGSAIVKNAGPLLANVYSGGIPYQAMSGVKMLMN